MVPIGFGPSIRYWDMVRWATLFVLLIAVVVSATPAVAQTKRDVDRADAARDAAYQRLVAANGRVEEAILTYELIASELDELNWRAHLFERRIGEYSDQVDGYKSTAREVVLDAYTGAGASLITAAFLVPSLQDLITSQALVERATDEKITALNRLTAFRREMERIEVDLAADQVRVEELEGEAKHALDDLEDAQRAVAAEYRRADDAAEHARARYEEEQRKRRIAELAKQRAAQAAKTGTAAGLPASATPGNVCPVLGGASFIDSWGFARSGGRRHKGTDMFGPQGRGNPLVAVTNGTVKLSSNSLGGITAYVYGDDGIRYYYAHMLRHGDVPNGSRVGKGTVIGYIGDSGNARGTNHLHFGMTVGGRSVNPYPTVRAVC